MRVLFLLLSLTPPHKCECVTCVCVSERERERCGVALVGEVLVLSPLCSAFLPPELLQAECAQEMLLSPPISPSHSLTLALPFSSLSLGTLTGPPPPLLLSSSSLLPPPPTSSLLSSSSYITGYVCVCVVLQPCSSAVPCATAGRGFLRVCIRWSSWIGNTIHQAPPPSPAHPSIAILFLLNLHPFSLHCRHM